MILWRKSRGVNEKDIPNIYEIFENAKKRLQERAQGYRIRNAEEKDLEDVRQINMITLPENYPSYFFRELWIKYGKSFYVAEAPGGKIVGYIMCRVETKPGYFKHFLVRSGHIVSIAVLEKHRRKGLGYALMAYALKSLYEEYNCSESYLEVRVTNKPAISLYEKLGYKTIKILHHYYLDGEDAFLMARPLP
ncbi:SSU ribosomal protein S18P alanine acetyltransferase [Staphylothermus marinus F1]|uniref:SSU ribosomal protein S18P alanine acetyltransferase n=1 Tax=Staphylothermus marinus (strain ATCC 43588 / DSM 3639 / JCM 9404 / F1) TaxID=399550 RepID=A3DPA8_STAMF|nr:N-acetyltransferase [Staphylothermus marinus]ABN70468.1 SSU ribosomal protein S18P alanine acetyltransferase [Staphylothermus marinus F1]